MQKQNDVFYVFIVFYLLTESVRTFYREAFLYKHLLHGIPLSPRDTLKHNFTSLKTYLIFSQLKANFDETVLRIHDDFL